MTDPHQAAFRAEALSFALPPLLVAAERIAASIAIGVHGRRLVGHGDSFWQFRPFVTGDAAQRIDWRQTARGSRAYVRETEWEAAQTVFLARDPSPRMDWRSDPGLPSKAERGDLLLLALAALLLRSGERVALFGDEQRPLAGRSALTRLAERLAAPLPASGWGAAQSDIPRHARIVLFSDFLAPLAEIGGLVRDAAANGAVGTLVQVLDPAERELPYAGRVRFAGLGGEGETLVPRVEAIRGAYANRLAAQIAGLGALAARAGWNVLLHDTGHRPETALLALHQALSAEKRR